MTMMGIGNGHYGKLKTMTSSKSVPHAHFHAQLCMHIQSEHKDTNTHRVHMHTQQKRPQATGLYQNHEIYSTKKGKHRNNILNVIPLSQIVNVATRSAPPHTNSNQI